jgi:hypothetical protein
MSNVYFWIFFFGGYDLIKRVISALHEQNMKKIEIQIIVEANKAKELEVVLKYGETYYENKHLIQSRLLNSLSGEPIRIDNKLQQQILDNF